MLSVVIITKNEEANIARCLESVSWADEIVILDSESDDKTREIAEKFKVKFFTTPHWSGFGNKKNEAVNLASNDWIFSIDADETVTGELKEEILNILQEPRFNGYFVKRKSFYLGKMINHGGWGKDYPLRLFNRKRGNFNDKPVHEYVEIEGETGKIESPILHYTYPTVSSHIKKIDLYTGIAAEENKGKKVSVFSAILRGFVKFLKMFFLKIGFLDGREGFVLACVSSFGVFVKYIKILYKK